MALLSVENLDAFYGDFQALFGISAHAIDAGETVAIIGSNGAGKSTFLKTITGMLPAAREAIRFDGEPIGGLPAPEIMKRGIAMVPEGRKLFPSLSRRGESADRRLRPHRLRALVAEDALRAVSRSSASAATARRPRCPAASSRWWRSAAR